MKKEESNRMGNSKVGTWCIFLLSVVLCLIFLSGEGRTDVLTLDEAVRVALANNRQILIAKEKIEEARQRIEEAKAGYLPTINLSGTYTRLSETPSMSVPDYGSIEMGKADNYLSQDFLYPGTLQQRYLKVWQPGSEPVLSEIRGRSKECPEQHYLSGQKGFLCGSFSRKKCPGN